MATSTPNCTNTLQRTINLAQNFARNAPLTFSGTSDLALQIGDWVRQFVLAPPFSWRFNRAVTTFVTVAGTQDYSVNVPTFGWLEKAVVTDNTGTSPVVYALENMLNLSEESVRNLPTRISARLDDGNGNISFRLSPPPDKVYTTTITYQNSPNTFSSMNDLWTPIPDYLSFLYNQGVLAKAYEYLNDPRFGSAMPLFLRQVIATNAGLDETQINIFLADRVNTAREGQTSQAKAQVGVQGRGMY